MFVFRIAIVLLPISNRERFTRLVGLVSCNSAMERETELTQSWNPELAALSDKEGLLKGIPLQIGGEMRTFSLPMPQDDDGTDISLKDWQLGPRSSSEATAPYSIKPFKGSVRTRFTPVEPRLDEDLSSRSQSSPDHFETPTTPRTPRTSSSGGTRSSSVSPSKSFQGDPSLQQNQGDPPPLLRIQPLDSTLNGSSQSSTPSPHPPGIAFDITLQEQSPEQTLDTEPSSTLRARSLRVSFKESVNSQTPPQRRSPPIVRHRSPLKSRSILPSKEVKALQPKWESSTKIRPTSTSSSFPSKPQVQAPLHGIKARKKKGTPRARAAAVVASPVAAVPVAEIEPERELQSSSGYLSEGRYLSSERYSRRSLDSQSLGHDEYGSNRLSRELTMSPIHRSGREDFGRDFESGRVTQSPSLNPSQERRPHDSGRYGDDDSDDDEVKFLPQLVRVSCFHLFICA